MSVVSLQIGQCGNQVGGEFFKAITSDIQSFPALKSRLEAEYFETSSDTFFNALEQGETLEARCVQVDMEEKVIQQMRSDASREGTWRYPKNYYSAKQGSGNNWAFGFLVHGPACESAVAECLRQELEKCDCVDGILMTMSLAGGTGSGVGTYLSRHLRDLCPKVPVLAQLVWPYKCGEISVQAYNAILSLGHFLVRPDEVPDGILVQENDVLHQACSKRLGNAIEMPLSALNVLMAHQLAGMLQPLSLPSPPCRRRLSQFLFNLSGPPDLKLYRLRCLPYLSAGVKKFSTETWPQLVRHGRQLVLTGAPVEDNMDWTLSPNTSVKGYKRFPVVAFSAVARGDGAAELLSDTSRLSGFLSDAPASSAFQTPFMGTCRPLCGYPRSLFLATNGGGLMPADLNAESSPTGTDPAASLRQVCARAWRLFAAKAYLHQYAQYGLEMDTFMDCFAVVEQTVHTYAGLAV
ncbi:unnamed protein product [Schistocephalus solidus]|uniref:Tubulin delta chain n=1 Tax=Schistocephalus solidus TaxID=70667 RepID=A0A0X3PVQ0_SCHSO|nr:unnamed protein product [Schistocephalus solidus]